MGWEGFDGNRWSLEIRGAAPFEEWVWFEAEQEEPVEKGVEGLKKPERSKTPQENLKN